MHQQQNKQITHPTPPANINIWACYYRALSVRMQQGVLNGKSSASPQAVADLGNQQAEQLEGKRLEDAQKEAEKVNDGWVDGLIH